MRHPEDDLQKAVMTYLRLQYPQVLALHCPNGGYRNGKEAARFKGLGVLAGTADILIFAFHRSAGIAYYGLAIELKIKPNKQSDSQKAFQQKIEVAGWLYELVWDFDHAKKTIDDYITFHLTPQNP